jgi:uncharacterized protein (DUF952 family)
MLIFHIAERARWDAAQLAGSYAWSTHGKTLDDEGCLHAAREEQWEDGRRRYYADVTAPLVLLVIDTDKLTSPWREDPVGDTTYPHIYGALNPAAVVEVRPLTREGAPQRTFFQEFFGEVAFRMVAGVLVMAASLAAGAAAGAAWGNGAALAALLGTLVVGGVLAVLAVQRRDRRLA